ncbi:DNA polymerase IV [Zoogloea sp.]|uniref:DNA polymerase Y family protein n=1 Tax=Zoogloea sp. TaxID=49181 RepID=UPI0025F9F4A2|nr:DNA polymerase IV [Zoogloea sp.]
MTTKSGEALDDELRNNTTIQRMDVAFNDFTYRCFSGIQHTLQRNQASWSSLVVPRLNAEIEGLDVKQKELVQVEEDTELEHRVIKDRGDQIFPSGASLPRAEQDKLRWLLRGGFELQLDLDGAMAPRLQLFAGETVAPMIEDRGIDEIYLDLTALNPDGSRDGARAIALRLQRAVREATGLSCSLGVAPNKLLAKLCSDLEKPAGITVVAAEDIPARIWPLPARRINGIGPKAAARLEALGIISIADLAAADPAWLQNHFGERYGVWLHRAAHGDDTRPVVTRSEPKSLSRETTFERDLHPRADKAELSGHFTRLCEQLAADLARKGYVGKTIGLKLRFDNFHTVTRDQTLPAPTGEAAAIRRAAGECARRVQLDRRIRLLGVRVASLSRRDANPGHATPQPAQAELFA